MGDSVCFEDHLRVEGVNFRGFGILPKYVMLDRDLTIEAKTIYAYFCSFAGNGDSTFPGREKILTDLRMSKDAYYKHFKLLTGQGYINVVQKKQEQSKFSKNIYTLVSNPKKFQDNPIEPSNNVAYSRIRFSGLKSVGYGMIPKAVMIDSRLPVKAKGIYAYFCSLTGSGNNAFPKMETILYHLQLSKDTYYKFYRVLCDLNYISVSQRHVDGRLQVNDYFLNDTPNIAAGGRKKVLTLAGSNIGAQVPKIQDTASGVQVPKKQDTEKQDTAFEVQVPKKQDTEKQDTVFEAQVPKIQDTVLEVQVPNLQVPKLQDTRKQDTKKQDTNINNLTNNKLSNNNSLYQQREVSCDTQTIVSFAGDQSEGESEKLREKVIKSVLNKGMLPYRFAQDDNENVQAMTEAIHFMTEWDRFYPNGYVDELEQRVYNLFNLALIDMCCSSRMMNLKGSLVSYAKVIDKINEFGRSHESSFDLTEISEPAMAKYLDGVLGTEIKNPLHYMRSCIWDAMQTGNIGFYEEVRRLGY